MRKTKPTMKQRGVRLSDDVWNKLLKISKKQSNFEEIYTASDIIRYAVESLISAVEEADRAAAEVRKIREEQR